MATWSSPCSMIRPCKKSTKKVVDLRFEFCHARFQTGSSCGQSPVILFCYSMCAWELSCPVWDCSHCTPSYHTGDFAMEPEKIKRGRPRKEARARCSVWLTPDVAKILREYSKYVGCAITETIENALNEKLPSMRRTLGIDA